MTDQGEWVPCHTILRALEGSLTAAEMEELLCGGAGRGELVARAGKAIIITGPTIQTARNWQIPVAAWPSLITPHASRISPGYDAPVFSLVNGTLTGSGFTEAELSIDSATHDLLRLSRVSLRLSRISFHRDDLHEFLFGKRAHSDNPSDTTLTAKRDIGGAVNAPTSDSSPSRTTARRINQERVEDWFRTVRCPEFEGERPPSWRSCWIAAKAHFAPDSVVREVLMEARRNAAPPHWQKPGPNRSAD